MMDFGEPWLIGGNKPQSDAYNFDTDRPMNPPTTTSAEF